MKVLKFGGSSVANSERILGVTDILKNYYSRGENFAVVFSAFGGITDSLIEMSNAAAHGDENYLRLFESFSKRHNDIAKELLNENIFKEVLTQLADNHKVLKNLLYGIFLVREVSPRTLDYVLSFGERNSCFTITHILRQSGINARFLDARKIIKTDNHFGAAKVDLDLTYSNIKDYFLDNPEIQIVTGFIASSKGGLTTTLGRGGSDYTASLLAAGLNAKLIEIWTDVDGVMTADPRKVKKAFSIKRMTYGEAMEMSHFGAKVIYPPTLQPALQKKIPLFIKNTFNPDKEGTFISDQSDSNGHPVRGISSISHISLLTLQGSGLFGVPGIAARLFKSLANADINVILITQGSSEHSITFAVQPQFSEIARRLVKNEFELELKSNLIEPIKLEQDLCVIAIVGENMRYQPGIAGRLFQALGKNGINCIAIAQGSSELNVSVVVSREDESKSLNALHEAFFLSDTKELHLFMVGTGMIGSALIHQINNHLAFLKANLSVEIKIIGLANSKKMIFIEEGIDLNNWKGQLQTAPLKSDLGVFVRKMKELNLSNTIFIDNTSDKNVCNYYETILDSSISISTPNKIAASSSLLQYRRLKTISEKKGVRFLYETNVGAGLPVLSTMKDLINSGDQIIKIEGILSGSLSYIFNSFTKGTTFSQIVKDAMKHGYTEPDPRVDLNGIDVQRKLLILAREAGYDTELEDVKIKNILPESCQAADSVDVFFAELKKFDNHFENLRLSAENEGKVMRFIGKLENGIASISLRLVGSDHPFFDLRGSDNMIIFTTNRYKERPLVIRGPGAGAEVTAAGVFAELITIGNFLK